MKEYKIKCKSCGQKWYATNKDFRDSRSMKKDISIAKLLKNTSLHTLGTHRRYAEQIAQMQLADRDPKKCPSCGSRNNEIISKQHIMSASNGENILTSLAIIFMPYIAFFILLIKKPFSPQVNRNAAIYCFIISSILFGSIYNRNITNDRNADINGEQITTNFITNSSDDEITTEGFIIDNDTLESFYRTSIENNIEKLFDEGLDFSILNYQQLDSMECGLWTCRNTFIGKMTKKEHTYNARVGHNKLYNNGVAKLFYIAIDGETIMWDEEGEDAFLKAVGE